MTVQQERAMFFQRRHGLLLRNALFVLTFIGTVALYFFLDRVDVPRHGIATGIIALIVAEFLILKLRWFWTGVEEALWLVGAYALISEIPHSDARLWPLVIAAAAAIAGVRVRNPMFGALAAFGTVIYFENRFDLGVVAGLVFGLAGALGLLRTWRRPSNEYLCIAIVLIVPAAAITTADPAWRNTTIALYAAFGILTFVLAIRFRHHALFFAGGIGIAIAAIELARTFPNVALEAKVALGGGILLATSWIASRALRDRTTGFVTTPSKLTPFDDELEILATVALPREEFPQKEEPGGRFGGAGATGK